MAIAFSAEYLYQGAKFLSSNPIHLGANFEGESGCPEALFAVARAVYSLGVLIVAPCGVLYHAGAAGARYLQSCFSNRNVQVLNTLIEQHVEAAAYDCLAWMWGATAVIAVAVTVSVFFFQAFDLIPAVCLIWALPIIALIDGKEDLGAYFLTYGYAEDPLSFLKLLPEETGRVYESFYIYRKLTQAGMVVDEPLSVQEIAEIARINHNRGNTPFAQNIALFSFLLRTNKVTPRYQESLQSFVNFGPELENAWRGAIAAATRGEGEEQQRAIMMQNFTERMQVILEALPEPGALVPPEHAM